MTCAIRAHLAATRQMLGSCATLWRLHATTPELHSTSRRKSGKQSQTTGGGG